VGVEAAKKAEESVKEVDALNEEEPISKKQRRRPTEFDYMEADYDVDLNSSSSKEPLARSKLRALCTVSRSNVDDLQAIQALDFK